MPLDLFKFGISLKNFFHEIHLYALFSLSIAGKMFLYILTTVICLIIFCVGFSRLKTKSQQHRSSFMRYMLGLTLEPRLTKVKWDWEDPHVVGESMSFFLKVIIC